MDVDSILTIALCFREKDITARRKRNAKINLYENVNCTKNNKLQWGISH